MSRAPANVDPEELTIVARNTLLDGLEALRDHRSAITVVGAQAVYLRTAGVGISTAAYTSDGDLGLDPDLLGEEPLLEQALRGAGFELAKADQPGLWFRNEVVGGLPAAIELDLLMAERFAGKGKRSAKVPPHDKMAIRRVPGLETAVVDRSLMTITALDGAERSAEAYVAGPVALLVAKAHKIIDRIKGAESRPDRLTNKDAGDVYRLFVGFPATEVAASWSALNSDQRVGEVSTAGLALLRELFGGPRSPGTNMAVAALSGDVPEDRVRQVCRAYVSRLPDA
ncbi:MULTISPECIES: hypothetical protein [Actinosynnema]|uniref:hypothetical protein n=1 Tax=Actinosynnema TaxID=40566 RepID=UPI0020A32FA2|nr:hypothetical protein [Actinosynnema pretiosum]MCP2093537.1 hypothetical protein [Actinosynnema pretiosum]